MTPTQFEAVERSKRFRAHIAQKAAELKEKNAPKPAPVAVAVSQEPENTVEDWVDRQQKIWFSIVSEGRRYDLFEKIQKECCRHFNLTLAEFLADRRTTDVVLARHIAMYLAKKLTFLSFPQIGKRFAGRDHTTVISGVRKMERLIKTDAELAKTISDLEARLK